MKKEKLSPSRKFNLANKNFKNVFYNKQLLHRKKFKYLDDWVLQKSFYLINNNKAYKNNKKIYKRGALVNVDFGVNVGAELSGNHFAIVLNKNDNCRNDKITVIPLSSHKHPNCIELVDTIRSTSIDKMRNIYIEILAILHANYINIHKDINETYQILESAKQNIYKISKDNNYIIDLGPLPIKPIVIDPFKLNTLISESLIEKAKKFYYKYGNSEDLFNKTKKIGNRKLSDLILDDLKGNNNKTLQLLKEVSEMYDRYGKTTYAKIEDITTISKMRIRKINIFDPVGDMIVSDIVLDKIEQEIKICFFKKQ